MRNGTFTPEVANVCAAAEDVSQGVIDLIEATLTDVEDGTEMAEILAPSVSEFEWLHDMLMVGDIELAHFALDAWREWTIEIVSHDHECKLGVDDLVDLFEISGRVSHLLDLIEIAFAKFTGSEE